MEFNRMSDVELFETEVLLNTSDADLRSLVLVACNILYTRLSERADRELYHGGPFEPRPACHKQATLREVIRSLSCLR